MFRLFIFLMFKFLLGGEVGASFSWSSKWQDKTVLGHSLKKIPEIIDALLMTFIAMYGYEHLGLNVAFHYELLISIAVFSTILAGIESATWMFLQWSGTDTPDRDRTSTLKPVVDWIASKFNWSLGDEGYSWVSATLKGTIITLPMGGLGGILFAFGYEIGSHFSKDKYSKYISFNPHIISEGLSFAGVGFYAYMFLEFCKFIGT